MSRFFQSRGWMSFLVIGSMLLAATGFTSYSTAQAQSICGSTYTVQGGDNLTEIANTCGTTVGALLQANPQITNPNLIYPGEVIYIPTSIIPITGSQAQVTISPLSGPAGMQVTVSGTSFPANTLVDVSAGEPGAAPASVASVVTDVNGNFTALAAIPTEAQAGSLWIITAAAQTSGGPTATAQFQVSAQLPSGPYTVQPGDTLSGIAQRFGTTVNALLRANPQVANPGQLTVGQPIYIPGTLASVNGQPVYFATQGDYLTEIAARFGITYSALLQANPQISDPSLIYPGQRINLPAGIIPITGEQAQVAISPLSGPAGTQVTVNGTSFPANTLVNVSVGESGAGSTPAASVVTDANGSFATSANIPGNAPAGSLWIITAAAQVSGGPTATAQFQVFAQISTSPYTVQSGDTLYSIAQRFDLTVNDLLRANPQINNANITPGQLINIPDRISFPLGGTSAVVTGNLAANSTYSYVLRAQANQLLQVNLTPENDLQLSIIGADGRVVKSASSGGAGFRGYLPGTQDYILALSAQGTPVNYTMNVNIPARISFAPGAISAQITGTMAANSNQYYILRAQANQNMQVNMAPQQGLHLSVYGVDGTVLQSGMGGVAEFRGILPSTQDYILVLTAGNSPVAYTMDVIIPAQ